jgi:hypothetical protein
MRPQAAARQQIFAQGVSPGSPCAVIASPERAAYRRSAALSGLTFRRTANPGLTPWARLLTPLRGFGQHTLTPRA